MCIFDIRKVAVKLYFKYLRVFLKILYHVNYGVNVVMYFNERIKYSNAHDTTQTNVKGH